MNNIQIFNNDEFGEIRVALVEGREYFYGVDIATALAYKRPSKAVTDNCKGVLYQDTIKNAGGYPEPLITEGDVYRLIVRASSQGTSKDIAEKADRFEKMVFDEILPSIRKTGGYQLPTTMDGKIQLLAQGHMELSQRIDTVEKSIQQMNDEMPLFPIDAEKITTAARRKGVEVMGGKDSMAYHDRSIVQTVYRDIYGEIHRQFGVNSYKEICRRDADKAMEIIQRYTLPYALAERVLHKNEAESDM